MKIAQGIRYLAIEGVIGAGKTSLARIVAERTSGELLLEQFEENPFLDKFYRDKEAWAFQTQLFFLLSRHKQLQEKVEQGDLFTELVVSDYTIEKDRIFASQNLSETELGMYDTIAGALEAHAQKPDFVVYLQASLSVLLNRIRKRDRPMERDMDAGYLRDLIERYNHHFFHFTDCPVLIVNTDQIDFIENRKHLENLLETIAEVPAGTTYYSPSGV